MKTKNVSRKAISFLLALILTMGIFNLNVVQARASRKISDGCAKAYARKINSLTKKNPEIKGYSYVIVRDMNKDGVPELLYNPRYTGSLPDPWTVYTYKKGKVKKIGSVSGSLYTVPGKKNKYKYEGWFGVGCCAYGYVTFGKSKVTRQKEAEYGGMPVKYYLKNKVVSESKYNKFMKNFQKSMTEKREIKATDTYHIKWTAKKVKSIL